MFFQIHHSTYLNSFWREVTRLLLELLAKARSLFSANRFAFPIEGCWELWPLLGSKMANFAFTNPLWSMGSLDGLLVSSKTWSFDLTIPSQTCSLCCWLDETMELVFRKRSLDSFSTTLLIRLSIFCDRDRRISSALWWEPCLTSDLSWGRYLGSLKWWWPLGREILQEASKYSTVKKCT